MNRDLFTIQRLAFDDEFRALARRSGTPPIRRLAEQLERMSPSKRKRAGYKARREAQRQRVYLMSSDAES